MKLTRFAFLILLLLASACSGAKQPGQEPFSIATLSQSGPAAPEGVSTPVSPSDYVLSNMPKCDGIETLEKPPSFNWPNIDLRFKELEGSYWGYYSCPQPQVDVAEYYRELLKKPPFNLDETNWVERNEGVLAVYFHPPSGIWTYLWVLPQPEDPQSSFVFVAKSNGHPFQGGECYLDVPQNQELSMRTFLELQINALRGFPAS